MTHVLEHRLKPKRWAVPLLACWLAIGLLLVIEEPWPVISEGWFYCLALFAISLFWRRRRTPITVLCASVLLIGSVWVAIQWLPIYSAGWGPLEKVEIAKPLEPWRITITDAADLARAQAYGARGSHHYLRKIGGSYEMWVYESGRSTHYFVHLDSLGTKPGGIFQPTFRPAQPTGEPTFFDWFNSTLSRHGHPRLVP
jgi:hypothetical protein